MNSTAISLISLFIERAFFTVRDRAHRNERASERASVYAQLHGTFSVIRGIVFTSPRNYDFRDSL